MRCVNETLPPRARLRWLLMTMRLSIMSFAGIVRTLVAVGTREARVHVGGERLGHALERGDRRPRARRSALGLGDGRDRTPWRAPRPGSAAASRATEVVRATGWLPVAVRRARLRSARRRGRGPAAALRPRRRSPSGAAVRAPALGSATGDRRRRGRRRRVDRAGSSRGSATTTGRPSSCRRGTARTSRRRATRWLRIRPRRRRRVRLRSLGLTQPTAHFRFFVIDARWRILAGRTSRQA